MKQEYLQKKILYIVAPLILVGICLAIYWPGISGPFVFDDYANIIRNSFLTPDTLDLKSLAQAAQSSESGPLGRPIPMLSFALNANYAGSVSDPLPFKITNVLIHGLNSILVFMLLFQLLRTQPGFAAAEPNSNTADQRFRAIFFPALLVAVAWAVLPIQLTSVLYVVQRMTSLSATFVLLALVSYVYGRQMVSARKHKIIYLFLLPLVLGVLGIFSKENAALLPLFILVIEITIFPDSPLLRRWTEFYNRQKKWVLPALLMLAVLFLGLLVVYLLPGYAGRPFTMMERLLTEGRILFFYISLILLPRINAFGLHHDDIERSVSLVDPWTTLPASLLLILLLAFAWTKRRQFPLASFGILFFTAGHALESSIFPLELVHEHRNYLPSLGILMALTQFLYPPFKANHRKMAVSAILLLLTVSAITTYGRASQWKDIRTLTTFEVIHHPASARAQLELSGMLNVLGRTDAAIDAARTAAKLDPLNAGYLMEIQILLAFNGNPDKAIDNRIRHLLSTQPISAFVKTQLQSAVACLSSDCSRLSASAEAWLLTILEKVRHGKDASYYYYLLGQTYAHKEDWNKALQVLQHSSKQDKYYAHPLFLMASIYVRAGMLPEAVNIREELNNLNKRSKLKWERDLAKLDSDIDRLRTNLSNLVDHQQTK